MEGDVYVLNVLMIAVCSGSGRGGGRENYARTKMNRPGLRLFIPLRLFWRKDPYHFLLFRIVLVLLLKVF